MKRTPSQWLEEANIAFLESGAQHEPDTRQEDWEAAWLAKHGRNADGELDHDLLNARCAEFDLPAGEVVECAFCDRLLWFADSWAPGHELTCAVCDTEVTGRVHSPHVDAMTMPPPKDVYPEVYERK